MHELVGLVEIRSGRQVQPHLDVCVRPAWVCLLEYPVKLTIFQELVLGFCMRPTLRGTRAKSLTSRRSLPACDSWTDGDRARSLCDGVLRREPHASHSEPH